MKPPTVSRKLLAIGCFVAEVIAHSLFLSFSNEESNQPVTTIGEGARKESSLANRLIGQSTNRECDPPIQAKGGSGLRVFCIIR